MTNISNNRISPKVIGAIIATGLMSFCGVAVGTATNITFPTLMQQFGVNTGTVQWMTTIYLLTMAIITPLSASLQRNFRTKSLFLFSNLAFIVGLLIDAMAPTFLILVLGRLVQGVGAGIALPLMFNIILSEVPQSKIGTMMGVGALITAAAPALGPTFGGIVVTALNWRFIFIFLLPLVIISLVVGILAIDKGQRPQRSKFDKLSILWIAITFIGLIYGFHSISNFLVAIIGIIIGIIALCLLFHRSNQISKPIVHLDIMKHGLFPGHVLAYFSLQLLTLGFSFILPTYIQIVNGKSAFVAAIFCLPGAIIGALCAPLGGKLLDNLGPRKPIMTGAGLIMLALILFVITGEHLSNLMIAVFYFIYMMGVGLSFGNVMTNGLHHLPASRQVDGNAILNTLMQFSGAVSTSIVSAIINHAQMTGTGSRPVLTAIGSEHALLFMLVLAIIEVVSVYKIAK